MENQNWLSLKIPEKGQSYCKNSLKKEVKKTAKNEVRAVPPLCPNTGKQFENNHLLFKTAIKAAPNTSRESADKNAA